ncbi:MAG: PD-(D/E)XK nuclease family protein [Bacteroidota bacterium]
MKPFLLRIAEYIHQQKIETRNLCVVLPNRRAKLFLNKHLASVYQSNIWAPEILSIEDLVSTITQFEIADSLKLLIELYKIHQQLETKQTRSFDDFMGSGMLMLHDFNDVDIALANANDIFSYLSETKAISRWSPDGTPLTENEKEYLRFFSKLKEYYQNYRDALLSKKFCYQGLAYRYAVENPLIIKENLRFDNLLFAGFNALSPVEEKLFECIQQESNTNILWDVDDYYFSNPNHEAGKFLRMHAKNPHFDVRQNITKDFLEPKKILVLGVPRMVGQAKAAATILSSECKTDGQIEKTALVLADESLLFPVLNSIPENVHTLNLTMGLPLRNTPMYSFFNQCFRTADNALRYQLLRKSPTVIYYFKDVIALLQHPYIRTLFSGEYDYLLKVITDINSKNRSFYTAKAIHDLFPGLSMIGKQFIEQLFTDIIEPSGFIKTLQQLLGFIRDAFIYVLKDSKSPTFEVELEYLFHFEKLFTTLSAYFAEGNYITQISTLKSIFEQLSMLESVPFYGEPLQGLQVLGLLETRTLDFENIILLSANEGIIPSGKHQQTFIPPDIRAEFGLQTHRDRESVMAYHFYHLLQRAKNIYLIYNTESGELGGGEKSRFIAQLMNELPKYNPNITIEHQFVNINPSTISRPKPIIIDKNSNVMQLLMQKATKGISPTSLINFLHCSIKFYFRDIVGLEEPDDITEEIDAKTLGTIMHDVLENLFRPYTGRVLKEEDFSSMQKNLYALIENSFKKNYQDGDIINGRNRLTAEVTKRNLTKQIEYELKQHLQFVIENQLQTVLAIEKWLDTEMEISILDEKYKVKLKGKCDRIDKIGNNIRIIDYKTGKVEQKELEFNDFDELISDIKYEKSFQLLMYAYLYSKNTVLNLSQIESGVSAVGRSQKGFLKLMITKDEYLNTQHILNFENTLQDVLYSLFDPSMPFQQAEDLDRCKYCPYLSICMRQL